jgi:Glycosyltransferase sugar-binding region containing DXD motif
MAIPNQVHFVWGFKKEPEPFHLIHYLCVESCRRVQGPERIYLHHHHLPYGPYWELLEPRLTVVPAAPVAAIEGAAYDDRLVPPAYRYAHHSDFVRLDALIAQGGIYADLDTLFVRPFPADLLAAKFAIGREADIRDERTGAVRPSLCNALLLSEPGSTFAVAWRRTMPHALNGTWSNHSTLLPYELSLHFGDLVHVEPRRSFYRYGPNREDLASLLEGLDTDQQGVLTVHLWAHLWWDARRVEFSTVHSGLFTEEYVRTVDTTYNVLARDFLPRR